MPAIYPIRGEFWPQDQWGRTKNIAVARADLDLRWSGLSEEAVDLAHERFGEHLHSVYLSGSAARNRPNHGVFLIILESGAPSFDVSASWARAAARELRLRAPVAMSLKVVVLRWRDVFPRSGQHSPVRFRLAVNSICVGGRNLSRLLPAQPLEAAVANTAIVSLEARLSQAKQRTLASDSRRRIRAVSADVGNAVVSAGYATVMTAEQLYTEDLDMRRDLFALNYPDLTDNIQRAYDMAAIPSNDPAQVRAFINDTRGWLSPITDAWLNQYNPERSVLLKS